MTIETKNFQSSMIDSAEYDPDTRTLAVTFLTNGATYEYKNVPPDLWKQFTTALSPGRFFKDSIKDIYR